MTTRSAPARRLASYWKMEAANVVFVPAMAAYVVLRSGGAITAGLVLSGLACSFLLVIGTLALRMMYRKASRGGRGAAEWIPCVVRMRWPALGLGALAAVAVVTEWINARGAFSAQQVAPAVLLLLAGLEYVNYYHVQLQHFDRGPDWRRLVSGRGFRRSHLAREIDRWEREKLRQS